MRDILSRMERDWDSRAREAPEYYIASAQRQWRRDEFFQSGEINVENEILSDPNIICRGKALEIGCGAGRMTRAMASVFGEVHAVDISAEMIALARSNLSDRQNVFLYKNNGIDLSELPDQYFDFAFSFVVFQHIPDLGVIESYVREVYRCLRPGSVFKFQVQGDTGVEPEDTWVGAPLSFAGARDLARRCGFEMIDSSGAGTQYFWLSFRKPHWPFLPKWKVRLWSPKPVAIAFSPQSVRPGEVYRVRIPRFAGQTIDVGYELTAGSTGVVSRWCNLDSRGEASINVPAEHPTTMVRITRVRSRTNRSRWYRAEGAIRVYR